MSKIGQIEIMGLVIVVLLITLGLFFSLSLQQPDTTPSELDTFQYEKLSSDFLITFLETKHQTCNVVMRDLAVDCVRALSSNQKLSCEAKDSCEVIDEVLTYILDETLNAWNLNYELTYEYNFGETQEILLNYNKGCTGGAQKSAPGIQPIVLYPQIPGQAFFTLSICR